MRFSILIVGLLLIGGLVTSCTLITDSQPTEYIVTATLAPDLFAVINTPLASSTPTSNPPTTTPISSATLPPTQTVSATMTPPPTLTPKPSPLPPTRTRPAPPPIAAIDDGSGNTIPGTGNDAVNFSPVEGLDALPHTLYYLSDYGITKQVFRVQIGLPYAEQLSFSPTGIARFDVAPDGTLAYITLNGDLVVGGVPFLTPANPDGSRPKVSELAWSPVGNSLVYYLFTSAQFNDSPLPPPTTGLWLRDPSGITRQLSTVEPTETGYHTYHLRAWRPDGTELLVVNSYNGGDEYARINVTTGTVSTVWDSASSDIIYDHANWTADGNAVIFSSRERIIRVNLDGSNPVTLIELEVNLNPNQLTQYQDSTIAFEGSKTEVLSLYTFASGQANPQALTPDGLSSMGRLEIEWGSTVGEIVVVAYVLFDDHFGTAYYRDTSGTLHDLTPLTGSAGQPQWGPTFIRGDRAIVNSPDPLNVRSIPGGAITRSLVNGSLITIIGGPREQDGYTWWQIQTPDNLTGWSVESIPADDGSRTRTLYPASN